MKTVIETIMKLVMNKKNENAYYFVGSNARLYVTKYLANNRLDAKISEITTSLSLLTKNGGCGEEIKNFPNWQDYEIARGDSNDIELLFIDQMRTYFLIIETKYNTPLYRPTEPESKIITNYMEFTLHAVNDLLVLHPEYTSRDFHEMLRGNAGHIVYLEPLRILWTRDGYGHRSIRAIYPIILQLLPKFNTFEVLPRTKEIIKLFALYEFAIFYREKARPIKKK